jgi:hypothetical protein
MSNQETIASLEEKLIKVLQVLGAVQENSEDYNKLLARKQELTNEIEQLKNQT